jgi:hypothetical protein
VDRISPAAVPIRFTVRLPPIADRRRIDRRRRSFAYIKIIAKAAIRAPNLVPAADPRGQAWVQGLEINARRYQDGRTRQTT